MRWVSLSVSVDVGVGAIGGSTRTLFIREDFGILFRHTSLGVFLGLA